MAEDIQQFHSDEKRFNKIFAYIAGTSAVAFAYVFCITFIAYPESKSNIVMIVLGFLLGNVIGSGIGFLLSGSPEPKKVQGIQTKSPITSEQSVTLTTTQQEPTITP